AINNLLTHPSQVGAGSAFNNAPPVAGGLAGVASTFDAPSIKIYKDQKQYNKWEFIFDLKQGLPGQPATPQQQPAQQQSGQQQNNSIGANPASLPPFSGMQGQIGPPPPVNPSPVQQ
ncbi:MAG: hypothetical protein ACRD30_00640, partial [Bryobacteraceae bacterium]